MHSLSSFRLQISKHGEGSLLKMNSILKRTWIELLKVASGGSNIAFA